MEKDKASEINQNYLNFSAMMSEAMYLAQVLQQEGNIDSESDLIKSIQKASSLGQMKEILVALRSMVGGNRSSGYR